MQLRTPDPARDFDEVLALMQACDRAVYGESDWTAEELREEWEGLDDLARDAWFACEWRYSRRPYDDWFQKVLDIPRFDPELCPVVWEGDELAAVSINYPKRMGNWGWIGTLAVRSPWRRRGLGLALLLESFRRFHGRGERVVALGVDAENPTGATRLYEPAGMGVRWRADVWRKEIRSCA